MAYKNDIIVNRVNGNNIIFMVSLTHLANLHSQRADIFFSWSSVTFVFWTNSYSCAWKKSVWYTKFNFNQGVSKQCINWSTYDCLCSYNSYQEDRGRNAAETPDKQFTAVYLNRNWHLKKILLPKE